VTQARRGTASGQTRREPVIKPLLKRAGGLRWHGTKVELYKQARGGEDWSGISRQVLFAGSRGRATAFDVRYFELSARGSSSLERHRHAHVVVGLSGAGQVRIGQRWHDLRPLDACYIGPNVTHQLRNASAEPFGFLCVVDADRDTGRPVSAAPRRVGTRMSK